MKIAKTTASPHSARRSGHGLLALLLLALLVVLGMMGYRCFGSDAAKATLVDHFGDAGKLSGFTLQGGVCEYDNWSSFSQLHSFSLKDGYLTSALTLDEGDLTPAERGWTVGDVLCNVGVYIAPTARKAVDAAAEIQVLGSSNYIRYQSKAQEFVVMVDLRTTQEPIQIVRFPAATIESVEETDVAATYWYNSENYTDYSTEYLLVNDAEAWSHSVTDALLVGQQMFFGWDGQNQAMPQGVYRVTQSLSQEQMQQLPRDVKLGEIPILAGSTAFGAVELFYKPQSVATLYMVQAVSQNYLAVVYQTTNGALMLDVVNQGGQQTDSLTLAQHTDGVDAVYSLQNTNKDDVSLFYGIGGEEIEYWTAVLRVQQGRIVACKCLPQQETLQTIRRFQFNKNATAVMLVSEAFQTIGLRQRDAVEREYADGYILKIFPLEGETLLYSGKINTAADSRWWQWFSGLWSRFYNTSYAYLSYAVQQEEGEL